MRVNKEQIKSLNEELSDSDFKEMAIPSYTHKNFLIRWLFIKRLKTIINFLGVSNEKVLDYGTGTGILLPYLSENSKQVYAADINTTAAKKMISLNKLENVKLVMVNKENNGFQINDDNLDVIIAADVLEHVNGLEQLIKKFSELLKEKGHLIVSGPSENFLYKLGRKIAGFKNEYHVRNIYDIKKEIMKNGNFKITKRKTLPCFFIPAFRIYVFEKISQDQRV